METVSPTKQKSGPPKTPEQLRNYLPYLINRLANRWNLDQNRDLSEHGLNNVVLRTLSILYTHKTLTVNELADLAVTKESSHPARIGTRHFADQDNFWNGGRGLQPPIVYA